MVELSLASPFAWFVSVFWVSIVFHLAVGYTLWITKAGRWTEYVGGPTR